MGHSHEDEDKALAWAEARIALAEAVARTKQAEQAWREARDAEEQARNRVREMVDSGCSATAMRLLSEVIRERQAARVPL